MVIHNSLTDDKWPLRFEGGKVYLGSYPSPIQWPPLSEKKPDPRRKETRKGPKCPKSLRKRVFAAFANTCQYCGWKPGQAHIGTFNCLTVDRILPGNEGGKYAADNVTSSCLLCNSFRQSGSVYGPVRPLSVMEAGNGR